jgi:hypothetical protein
MRQVDTRGSSAIGTGVSYRQKQIVSSRRRILRRHFLECKQECPFDSGQLLLDVFEIEIELGLDGGKVYHAVAGRVLAFRDPA